MVAPVRNLEEVPLEVSRGTRLSCIRISDTAREHRYTCTKFSTKFSTKVSTVTQVVKPDHVRRPILNIVRITRKFDVATNICMSLLKHCIPLIDFDYPIVIIRVAGLLFCVCVSWVAGGLVCASCVPGAA
jgi:hypothetical protein